MTTLAAAATETLPDDGPERVVLADGAAVLVRLAQPEDREGLRQMFYRLSPQSAYFWAFLPVVGRPRWAEILASLARRENEGQYAIVALVDGETVGVARYDLEPGTQEAEIGIVIEDRWQGRGLGKVLARRRARQGSRPQITRFTAHVLGENRRVLRLLVAVFASVKIEWEHGEGFARLEQPI